MLAFLAFQGFAASYIKPRDPAVPEIAAFAFAIAPNPNSIGSTFLKENEGYFVAVQFYDKNGAKTKLDYLNKSHKSPETALVHKRVKVWYSVFQNTTDRTYCYVNFYIQNDNTDDLKVDIGVCADLSIGKALSVTNIPGNKGFTVSGQPSTSSYTFYIFTSHAGFPAATGKYIAEVPSSTTRTDPTKLPYWDNGFEGKSFQTEKDVMMSFHWTDKTIRKGSTYLLGFAVTTDADRDFIPYVQDTTAFQKNREPNSDFEVIIEATSVEAQDCTIYLEYPDPAHPETTKTQSQKFTATNDKMSGELKHSINAGKTSFFYNYWAEDAKGKRSEVRRTKVKVARNPNIVIQLPKKTKYYQGESIHVEGKIYDDQYSVQIKYSFEEQPEQYLNDVDSSDEGTTFSHDFPIPKNLPPSKNEDDTRMLYINIVDDDGNTNYGLPVIFELLKSNAPYLDSGSLHVSQSSDQPDRELVFSGEVFEIDDKQRIDFFVLIDDSKDKIKIGNITSNGENQRFEFPYDHKGSLFGKHKFTIIAADEFGSESEPGSIEFRILDEAERARAKHRKAKIIKSDPKSANACFDLKFQEEGKNPISMTHNDEGFYVGYRLFNKKGIPGQTNLLKHTEKFSQTDNIKVQFSTKYEEVFPTYLKLIFNVTNFDYYPQTIDLGVFTDSDFNGDTNTVITNIGRDLGYSVTGNDLHYSFFVKQFLDHIDVNHTWFGTVKRPPSGEIPINDMKLFLDDTSNVPTTSQDTMYSFTWRKHTIPPETSVLYEVTFAPNDYVNTPSRVLDITDYPNDISDYYEDQNIEITIRVDDADYNQDVELFVDINGTSYNEKYTINRANRIGVFRHNFVIPKDTYFMRISAYATDSNRAWASNKVETIKVWTVPPEFEYVNGIETILTHRDVIRVVSKSASHVIPGHLRYQFDNAKIETCEEKLPVIGAYDYAEKSVECSIKIPPAVAANLGEHTFKIWAENIYGEKSYYVREEFIQIVEPKPELGETGFGLKTASVGDSIVAYAVVKCDLGKRFSIYAKIGNDDERFVKEFTSIDDNFTPYGFFYRVPNVPSAVYDIRFIVKVSDTISEYSSATLYVRK